MFHIKQENRNLIRKQDSCRQFHPQHFYTQNQKPFIPKLQRINRSILMYYNRPQLPHNYNLPTLRQTYYQTTTNNQN